METDRETQLLKQSIIVYSRDVCTKWHLKSQQKQSQVFVFNKRIIPLTLVGYEIMIAVSVLRISSAI